MCDVFGGAGELLVSESVQIRVLCELLWTTKSTLQLTRPGALLFWTLGGRGVSCVVSAVDNTCFDNVLGDSFPHTRRGN